MPGESIWQYSLLWSLGQDFVNFLEQMLDGLVKRIALDFDVEHIAKAAKTSKEAKIAGVGADIELLIKQSWISVICSKWQIFVVPVNIKRGASNSHEIPGWNHMTFPSLDYCVPCKHRESDPEFTCIL